jgi:hypothetical protein
MLCPGQVYRSTLTIAGQAGAPSSATLTITKPDGTLVTPALGAGSQSGADWVITYDYALPTAGQFKFTWTTTGPGTAPFPDYVNVRDFISLIGLAEGKLHLGITVTTYDDEIANFLMASAELVEDRAGPCVRRDFTDRVYDPDGSAELLLPRSPVLAVTSVTSKWPGGPSWAAADLAPDLAAGVVAQASRGLFWLGPWDVLYTCGRVQIPERLLHAQKEQLRHLWETQRGADPPQLLGGEETFTTSAGFTFSVPRRVTELLGGDMVPVF